MVVYVASECVYVCELSSLIRVIDFCDLMCVSLCVKWYPIKDGRTAIWDAARYGLLKVVEYLATEAKANPNQPDKVLSVTLLDVCDGDVCLPEVTVVHTRIVW